MAKAIKVTLLKNGVKSKTSLPAGSTVAQAIAAVGLNRETLIPKLNGEISSLSEKLGDGDELELIGIIYGG